MVRRSCIVLLVAASAVVACSSLPDLGFEPEGDGGTGVEGGGKEGGSEGGVDAGPDVVGCVKTGPEICDDGIDNDCNGSFDCADPACTAGYTCTDAPPAGWQIVAFTGTTRPACPANYGLPTDVKTSPGTGAGTCSCQCNAAVGSTACSAGQASAVVSDQNVCTGGVTDSRSVNANAAVCTALSSPIAIPPGATFAKATPPAPPAACASATTLSVPAIADGRLCAPPARLGNGCPGGQVCAPRATGMAVCAAKVGPDNCPATYPKRAAAGTSATDNRACNACTCAPQAACPAPTVTLYTASDCSTAGGEKSVLMPAACAAPATKNVTAQAYKSTTVGSGCAPSGFNATSAGSIAWVGEETVCCK